MNNDATAFDPFSVCFNKLKMKYKDLDELLTINKFINSSDEKVNVFINLETVYKYISMIADLEKRVIIQRDFDSLIESNMLNLVGHYKRFFASNNIYDVKIYIYQTNFNSVDFKQIEYNEDYRSYYNLKYKQNPKFTTFSDAMDDRILGKIKTYLEFIPNSYFIMSNDIEGSLIPLTIAMNDPSRKNILIGGEFYETQYSLIPSFFNIYINKIYSADLRCVNMSDYLGFITKKTGEELKPFIDTFNTYPMYCALLSILGDKQRSISGLSGYGPNKFLKHILLGIESQEIQQNVSNPISMGTIFHNEEVAENFKNNYYCTCLAEMYKELNEAKKKSIINQCVDRCDYNSLDILNRTRFVNHPIVLENLFY